jgi:Leucine-rich repeat (LRR) protein
MRIASLLQLLMLDRTQVSDIAPLAGLTALRRLDLTGSQASDIAPLTGLKSLSGVYVESDSRRAALARTLGQRAEIVKALSG